VDQALALEILHAGHSVLLTGPAGAGKTYVLNQFIRAAKKDGRHVSVTATTGLAATHVGGSTIHAWSGIGVADELKEDFEDYLLKSRRDIIETTDVLVIDEISMLHDYRLDMVNHVAKAVRDDERPFGGIQVILCGDFFQLPPVNRNDGRQGGFVTHSEAWAELDPVICYLNEQHRQDDDEFLDILNALRGGDVRRRHAERLMERVGAELSGEAVTELHVTNVNVDMLNQSRLQELAAETHYYDCSTTGAENYVASLKRSCLAMERLALKEGALVMAIKNSQERKYVNGSLGIVIGFEKGSDYPIVEFKNGKTVTMRPDSWELRDGDKKRAGLSQIPLRLAWAITVHKSQGMTLDSARVDLRRAFVEGMGYVALSRVRRLDSLSLLGINRMALQVSADALQIDDELRSRSAQAAKQYEKLRAKAGERIKKSESREASTWTERLDKMREKHPNAYKPWTPAEDDLLKAQFESKKTIKELSSAFGRHDGSIRARLKKYYGEDVVLR
jgi:ATP-dependent exoDNAse (exonuclease V) alpha subunit